MRLRCFLFSGCLSVATLAASLVLAIASDRAFAPTVLAHDCGNWPANPDARCYAIAQESGGPWGGVRARWDIQDVYAQDSADGGFAIQDIWAVTTSNASDWAEVFYGHGWGGSAPRFYWYEWVTGYGGDVYRIENPLPGPVGSKHKFEISQDRIESRGQVVFKVYIDDICVDAYENSTPVGCESWHNPGRWVVKMEVGAEDARAPQGHYATVGPTHASYMLRRATDSGNWFNWVPTGKYVDAPNDSFFEYYGDYTRAVYGMGIQYRDPFEGPDGSDPNWPKTTGYWSESGGNIFIHNVPNNWSHLHMDYSNAGGYLLMRRDKNDTYSGSTIVVEFGYGEDSASQAGRFFGIWGNGSQMGLGVHTGQWPNTYFYRVSNSTTLINTGITRTNAWHIFRFYITSSGCSYGELVGSDGIWDNAVYFHR